MFFCLNITKIPWSCVKAISGYKVTHWIWRHFCWIAVTQKLSIVIMQYSNFRPILTSIVWQKFWEFPNLNVICGGKSLQWLIFFNQFVCFTSFDGRFSTFRSTMELHGFLERSVLKVFNSISKSQHRRFQSNTTTQKWLFDVYRYIKALAKELANI